jgi:hypothetical protein
MKYYIVGNKDKTKFLVWQEGDEYSSPYYYIDEDVSLAQIFSSIEGANEYSEQEKENQVNRTEHLIINMKSAIENAEKYLGKRRLSIAINNWEGTLKEHKELLELLNNKVIYEVEFILKEIE